MLKPGEDGEEEAEEDMFVANDSKWATTYKGRNGIVIHEGAPQEDDVASTTVSETAHDEVETGTAVQADIDGPMEAYISAIGKAVKSAN